MTDQRPPICAAIDLLATRASLSSTELARRTGLDRTHILRVRDGSRWPSGDTIDKLVAAMPVRPGRVYSLASEIANERDAEPIAV